VKLFLWLTKYQDMKRGRDIASCDFNLGARWRWMVSFTLRPLYLQGKSPQYSLYGRLSGSQNWFRKGGEEKISLYWLCRELNPGRTARSLVTMLTELPGCVTGVRLKYWTVLLQQQYNTDCGAQNCPFFFFERRIKRIILIVNLFSIQLTAQKIILCFLSTLY
jgi:hypothetical protein